MSTTHSIIIFFKPEARRDKIRDFLRFDFIERCLDYSKRTLSPKILTA